MADFGQFPDPRTAQDYRNTLLESRAVYGDAPRIITLKCGARASLDMDGCGYRCHECFAVSGSAAACR